MPLTAAPLRALLVDDDASIRAVVSRILKLRFRVEVVECDNGLAALAALAADRYAFVLLDLDMPKLDGVQVLQAMRDSTAFAQLPVVVISGSGEVETVSRVASCGVARYLLKPILPGELNERLSRLIASIREQDAPPLPAAPVRFQPLTLTADTRVLIVDGSTEFRQFFTKTVGHLCAVEEAASGLAALERCQDEPPYAVFIGSDLGVMKGEMLARNLQGKDIRIIGVQPPRLGLRPRKASPYEVIIVRSFVPEVFMEGLQSLLLRHGSLAVLRADIPDLNLLSIAAAEEAISAMLDTPLALGPVKTQRPSTRHCAASTTLQVGVEMLPLTLRLTTPERCLPRLVERWPVGAEVAPEPGRLLCRLVERIGELLAREFEARGLPVTKGDAQPDGSWRNAHAETKDWAEVVLSFATPPPAVSLRLEIGVRNDAATASPVM